MLVIVMLMRWQCYGLGRRDSGGCVGRYGLGFRVTLELPRVLFDLINQRSPRIFTSIISLWLYFLSILFHLLSFYIFFTLWSYSLFIRPQLSFYRSLSFTISLFSVPASISLFSCIPHSLYFILPHSFVVLSFSLPSFPMFLSPPFLIVFTFLPSLRVFFLLFAFTVTLLFCLLFHIFKLFIK